MKLKISILGSGFSALSAACYLAKAGHEVTIYEKNDSLGGRARNYTKNGFTFDLGPTWYWMPDVFEKFFNDFDFKVSDFYALEKLDPAYEVFFGVNEKVAIGSDVSSIVNTFENLEAGSGALLQNFLKDAATNYDIAIKDLVYQPGESILELVTLRSASRLHQLFYSIQKKIRGKFTNPKLIQILEFPVLFLGAKPSNTPAMYNFMNWADFGLGTWHPKGGMYQVVNGFISLAKKLGVQFELNAPASKIVLENNKAIGIEVNGKTILSDIVLSGADYHHTESLLPLAARQYNEQYWNKKTLAPSALLFYVAINKKIKNVAHHTLFFDSHFEQHAEQIYDDPQWPSNPLFYARFPSLSDESFAPEGKETCTFLIPIAADLEDNETIRAQYFEAIISRFEKLTQQEIRNDILFYDAYCINDFKADYNSYKGNAYGLANTLMQTAILRPKLRSKKVKNLFFTGQLTVPGPGVPPAIISGKIVADLIIKKGKK